MGAATPLANRESIDRHRWELMRTEAVDATQDWGNPWRSA